MELQKNLIPQFILALCSLFAVTSASAERVSYRYDELGRLIETCVYSSPTQSGRDTDIVYDKADNRTSYRSSVRGFRLNSGQTLYSANSLYYLIMQNDGNLVLRGPSGTKWKTNTVSTGSFAMFQGDGNLVVFNTANAAVWDANTDGNLCASLQIKDDGNMVIDSRDNAIVWATNTAE